MECHMLRSPYLVMMFMVLFCSLLYVAHSGSCDNNDITVVQGQISTTGIPQFSVQISNTCGSGTDCAPSNIHLSCGWFASANLVNPNLFKRLEFDDCLVNNGMPLNSGQIVSFTYSNTMMYPLKFKSAEFC